MKTRSSGTGGKFDFGEPGYLDAMRKRTPPSIGPYPHSSPYELRCNTCGENRHRLGGKRLSPELWVCRECLARKAR